MFSFLLAAASGFIAGPALATTYTWNGSASTNWSTAANWNTGSIAPTGGSNDVTIVVTNRTNNTLYYTAANGSSIFTSAARPLRIGDSSYGSFAITGGSLETRGGNNGDFVGNGTGSGSLLVDGGTYISSTNQTFNFGVYSPATATLTVNSGFLRTATLSCGSLLGTINLNGGTLSASMLNYSAGTTTVNLNGGTLQAWKSVATWLDNSNTGMIYKVNGNVTLDTQAFSAPVAGSLNGTGSVTKVGSGSLSLQNSNTLAAVTLNEGTLTLSGANTISNGVTLNAGTLCISHAGALGPGPLNINGGKIDNTSTAAVINAQGGPINIYSNFNFVGTKDLNLGTGAVTLCRSLMVTNSAKTLTFGGSVGDGGSNYALTVTGIGLMAINGNLGIGGRLTLAGSGSLTLAGANSYTGATTISAGMLIVANSAALGTTNGASDVASGATLALTNGVVVESETVYIAGTGFGNFGALQALPASTNTWNGVVMLNESVGTWVPRIGYRSSGVLILGGPVKSSSSVNSNLYISGEPGSGRVVVAGTNSTYAGVTGLIRGTLALGANNALPVGTTLDVHPAVVTDPSKFDLNGFSQTVAVFKDTSVTGTRFVTNSSDTASVLTVNQSASTTYSGRFDGNVSLVKDGNGTLTLAGTNNAYTGATTLKKGTLALGADGALSPDTSLTISNATLVAGTWRNTVKQLTVTGAATIALGDGSCRLEFADCSGQAWTGTLELTGQLIPTGTQDPTALRFGTSSSALTPDQLGRITMGGNPVWVGLNAYGYLRKITGTVLRVY